MTPVMSFARSLLPLVILALVLPSAACGKKNKDEPGKPPKRDFTLYVLIGGDDGVAVEEARPTMYKLEDGIEIGLIGDLRRTGLPNLPSITGDQGREFWIYFKARDPGSTKGTVAKLVALHQVPVWRLENAAPSGLSPGPEAEAPPEEAPPEDGGKEGDKDAEAKEG